MRRKVENEPQRKMLLPLKEIDETPFGLLFRNLQRSACVGRAEDGPRKRGGVAQGGRGYA